MDWALHEKEHIVLLRPPQGLLWQHLPGDFLFVPGMEENGIEVSIGVKVVAIPGHIAVLNRTSY